MKVIKIIGGGATRKDGTWNPGEERNGNLREVNEADANLFNFCLIWKGIINLLIQPRLIIGQRIFMGFINLWEHNQNLEYNHNEYNIAAILNLCQGVYNSNIGDLFSRFVSARINDSETKSRTNFELFTIHHWNIYL